MTSGKFTPCLVTGPHFFNILTLFFCSGARLVGFRLGLLGLHGFDGAVLSPQWQCHG